MTKVFRAAIIVAIKRYECQ